jgi:glycosyltransferase involved in cell wall biosynthesis
MTGVYPNDGIAEVTFVRPELTQLAAVFDEVLVVPGVKGKVCSPLPVGAIRVDESYSQKVHPSTEAGRIGHALRGLGARWLWVELRRRPALLGSPRMFRRLLYCVESARLTGDWLIDLCSKGGIDSSQTLVYTFWLDHRTAGAGLARNRFPRLKIVSRAHGTDVYEDRHPLSYLPLRQQAVEATDWVFAVSQAGRRHLRARFPRQAEKITEASLGTVEPGFTAGPSGDGKFRIVSCAVLSRLKRVERLIDALSELCREELDRRLEWTHLGGGELQREIEARASALLSPMMSWRCTGPIPPERVLEFYRENPVDLFVSLSESEGKPISIMEAQSVSIPVLATAVGGVPELVDDSNGWLLSQDPTPKQIADAIRRAIGDHPSSARRRAGRESWETKHDARQVSAKFARRLRGLLDSAPPSPQTGGSVHHARR